MFYFYSSPIFAFLEWETKFVPQWVVAHSDKEIVSIEAKWIDYNDRPHYIETQRNTTRDKTIAATAECDCGTQII